MCVCEREGRGECVCERERREDNSNADVCVLLFKLFDTM